MNMWKKLMSVCICGVLMMGMVQLCTAEETANASTTPAVASEALSEIPERSEVPESSATPSASEITEPSATPGASEITEPSVTPGASEITEPTATPDASATPEATAAPTSAPTPVAPVAAVPINVKVVVNGKPIDFSDKLLGDPMVQNGRTYLPLRQLALALGGQVAWRSVDSTAHVLRNGLSIRVSAGNPMMTVNEFSVGSRFRYTTKDKDVAIVENVTNVTPFIKLPENRMMIPFASLVRELGGETRWSQEDMTVYVTIEAVPTRQSDIDAFGLIEGLNYFPQTDPKALIEQGAVTIIASSNDNKSRIAGVTIELGGQTGTTNAQGICEFKDIVAGEYEIKIVDAGEYEVLSAYANKTVTVTDGSNKAMTFFFKVKEETSVVKEDKKVEGTVQTETEKVDAAKAAE